MNDITVRMNDEKIAQLTTELADAMRDRCDYPEHAEWHRDMRIENNELTAELAAAESGLYEAWIVIASAGEGDWANENEELDWHQAAARWHTKYADAVSRAMQAVAVAGGEGT